MSFISQGASPSHLTNTIQLKCENILLRLLPCFCYKIISARLSIDSFSKFYGINTYLEIEESTLNNNHKIAGIDSESWFTVVRFGQH